MTIKRKRYIGASEVAALFDSHPYMTRFELWHMKAGNIEKPKFASNERSFWGDVLEPSIAAGFCKMYGYELIDFGKDRFRVHPTIEQCCANLDYGIMHPERGYGLLECKGVDFMSYRDDYPGGNLPLNYELQLQQELMCEPKAGYIINATLVGGNELITFDRSLRPAAAQRIETAINDFWQSIADNNPPAPDYSRDSKIVARLHRERDGTMGDWRGNNYLNNLCAEYKKWAAVESDAKRQKDAAKCEIIPMLGRASVGFTDAFNIKATTTADAEIAFTRKAYLNLTITERK